MKVNLFTRGPAPIAPIAEPIEQIAVMREE